MTFSRSCQNCRTPGTASYTEVPIVRCHVHTSAVPSPLAERKGDNPVFSGERGDSP